jgi:hypothetical protein
MADSLLRFKKLEWKWVWITMALYVAFYFLPIFLIGSVLRPHVSVQLDNSLLAIWFLGGIFLVSAYASFKSRGITVWEPVVSSVGAVVLMFLINSAERALSGHFQSFQFYNFTLVSGVFFAFSLVGAVCGELLQQSMEEQGSSVEGNLPTGKFQWLWVVVTLIMYIVLYLFPLYLFGGAFSSGFPAHAQRMFSGTWVFAGIIITAGLAGFMSKGVTIWEPVVGSVGFIILVVLMNELAHVLEGGKFHLQVRDNVTTLVFFFLLSLLGSWMGESWQKGFLKVKGQPTEHKKSEI